MVSDGHGPGTILLHEKTTFARGAAASLLGPTSFFLVSNFSVWASGFNGYPHTLAGLGVCYLAGVPFYRNDLVATSIVLGVALGVPALVRRMRVVRRARGAGGKVASLLDECKLGKGGQMATAAQPTHVPLDVYLSHLL